MSESWGTEWNRTIGSMPIGMYMDWRKAGRPGFAPMDNLKLQQWVRTWKIKDAATRSAQVVPHRGRVA